MLICIKLIDLHNITYIISMPLGKMLSKQIRLGCFKVDSSVLSVSWRLKLKNKMNEQAKVTSVASWLVFCRNFEIYANEQLSVRGISCRNQSHVPNEGSWCATRWHSFTFDFDWSTVNTFTNLVNQWRINLFCDVGGCSGWIQSSFFSKITIN